MPTFLQLCAKLATRSGVIGAAPVAVTGQAGRQAKCVDWIEQAWVKIQQMHGDWSFLQGEFSGTLTAGDPSYTSVDLGIASRFAEWKGDRADYRPLTIRNPALGLADEQPLVQISYDRWRLLYDRGAQASNRPLHYAIGPDFSLRFGPKPDKAYAVRGEYRKAPQSLAADADLPDMPERFHDIIVDRAIILISESDEAPQALQSAVRAFGEGLFAMRRDLLPEITTTISR